jgi:fumarate reductase subunit D
MSSIAIKDVKFRLTIASYAFLVLALLALTHYVLIIATEGLNLIPRSEDHPLVDILIPTWGHCGNIILRVLVLILGFTTYVTLFSAVSLGLSALTSPRYSVLLVLLFVLGIVIPAFNGLYSQSYSTLYYPVYTVPNVLLESGFRGLLYCMGLTIEWKNPLYQFYAELAFFALPQILLPIILLVTYMRVRRISFLVPLIISIISPIKILLILVLLLSPPNGAFLLFLLMIALAPVYGVLLWGSLAIAFLKLAKGKSL